MRDRRDYFTEDWKLSEYGICFEKKYARNMITLRIAKAILSIGMLLSAIVVISMLLLDLNNIVTELLFCVVIISGIVITVISNKLSLDTDIHRMIIMFTTREN